MHTRPHRRPRTQVPKSRVCKLRTAYLGAALCKRAQRQPNANSKLLDGCSTDPEPDMEKRQAFFRNMRSVNRINQVAVRNKSKSDNVLRSPGPVQVGAACVRIRPAVVHAIGYNWHRQKETLTFARDRGPTDNRQISRP